jgi:hypothetical protein
MAHESDNAGEGPCTAGGLGDRRTLSVVQRCTLSVL